MFRRGAEAHRQAIDALPNLLQRCDAIHGATPTEAIDIRALDDEEMHAAIGGSLPSREA
jgi:hypothetical protein